MPSVPVQYAADHVTTLLRSFTSKTQTTGITANPLQHNGEVESWQILGPQILRFSKGKYVEYMYFATAAVDSTTKVITFGTATRDITWKDGATVTQLTTGVKKWGAGTKIELVWSAQAAENALMKDQDQTMSGNLSMAAQKYVDLGDFTTAQETGLPDGSIWHNTDTNTIRMKVGGSITDVGDTGTQNGSTTVAGKYEEATVAEQGSATATGATGARLIPAVANLVKTSSGSGDENKLVVLDANGRFADGFLGSGSASSSNYLRGDRSWASISIPLTLAFGDASDGDVTLAMDTTISKDMNYGTLDLAGFTLNMAGYKVFARRVTDSVGGGKLKAPTGGTGGNGTAGSSGTGGGGGSAGAAASGVTIPDSTAGVTGGAGGNGGSNNNGIGGSNGTAGNSVTNSIGTTSGSVGASGGSGGTASLFTNPQSGGVGGAAGTATATSGRKSFVSYQLFATNKGTTFTALTGAGSASGGGGGAGGNGNSGSTGGGGGGAGGTGGNGGYWLCGIAVMDGNWNIESLGGAGGTGGNGANSTGANAGGGGGGAGGTGGSGGSGVLFYGDKTAWTGTLALTGGAGGTGGTAGTTSGGGTAAAAGSTGTTGASGIGLQIPIT